MEVIYGEVRSQENIVDQVVDSNVGGRGTVFVLPIQEPKLGGITQRGVEINGGCRCSIQNGRGFIRLCACKFGESGWNTTLRGQCYPRKSSGITPLACSHLILGIALWLDGVFTIYTKQIELRAERLREGCIFILIEVRR